MNSRRIFISLLAVFWITVAVPVSRAQVPSGKPARDLTFFVVSDTHYGLSPEGDKTVPLLVDKMNTLPGTQYPAGIGGKVAAPRGVLHIGDITNDGKKEQWEMFVKDYGLTGKDGRLKWPVYECYGNHDGGPKTPVRDGTDWWIAEDWAAAYAAAKPYNVILYLYGHTGTGVGAWAPTGEEKKWTLINDGHTDIGFFVVNITVTFDPVKTSAIKLETNLGVRSDGISEWKVN